MNLMRILRRIQLKKILKNHKQIHLQKVIKLCLNCSSGSEKKVTEEICPICNKSFFRNTDNNINI